VLYALSGLLCFPSLVHLSNTDRHLHVRLCQCPAVWKRSIRLGGLTRATRSAVWLSILYGGTPWLHPQETVPNSSSTALASVPHHLKARDQRKKIYEGLLIKLGTRIADGLLQKSFDEDSDDVDTARLVVWLREIDVDVVRTCSRAVYATKSATPAEMLSSYRALLEATIRRVLRAYVMYNPRVGYCQGMNFLVRLLMEVCCGDADEADCFWLFVGLCEPENDRNLYEPGLAVLQPLFVRFEEMLAIHKPQLLEHLQREGVPVAAYTARWFLTFFSACETFDASVVIRILDAFAIDGWRVIFGMAIVVLDELEPLLLAAEMEEILRVLQSPRYRLADRDQVEQIVRRGLVYSLPYRLHAASS
jgi:hypothetical protein